MLPKAQAAAEWLLTSHSPWIPFLHLLQPHTGLCLQLPLPNPSQIVLFPSIAPITPSKLQCGMWDHQQKVATSMPCILLAHPGRAGKAAWYQGLLDFQKSPFFLPNPPLGWCTQSCHGAVRAVAVLALRESVAEHFANVGAKWEASEIPVWTCFGFRDD